LVQDGLDPEVVARAGEILRAQLADPESAFLNIDKAIAGMTAKALVIHSFDDDACPVANAQAMADLWPGAELFLADDLGHRLIAQDHAIVQRIVDFVEGF
jgi:pimeloyl-ACP methyl ester carboxylesterase